MLSCPTSGGPWKFSGWSRKLLFLEEPFSALFHSLALSSPTQKPKAFLCFFSSPFLRSVICVLTSWFLWPSPVTVFIQDIHRQLLMTVSHSLYTLKPPTKVLLLISQVPLNGSGENKNFGFVLGGQEKGICNYSPEPLFPTRFYFWKFHGWKDAATFHVSPPLICIACILSSFSPISTIYPPSHLH